MNLQAVKLRFGIIGNSEKLNRALEIALQVAPTDLTVLINGESGTGKEIFAQVIHAYSTRKHNNFIAVNCGAIPDGTIDSELFGHEKGAFTGAHESRKGYFEVVDKGTIFLDEVAELPLSTQVRLLRVLETGEFLRVGSSKVQKTDVRVIAASNVDFEEAIRKGKFREDLYYRLSTVPIYIPPLRERGDDIYLLFTKFAADFSEKYRMPPIRLTPDAKNILLRYHWPGNVRQLKNITEQISIIEKNREIDAKTLLKYLNPAPKSSLPAVIPDKSNADYATEREILFKFLYDIKRELDETKKAVNILLKQGTNTNNSMQLDIIPLDENEHIPQNETIIEPTIEYKNNIEHISNNNEHVIDTEEVKEEEQPLSLEEMEKNMITKALKKYHGKRKLAAQELGISERTLYRKIKQYGLDL